MLIYLLYSCLKRAETSPTSRILFIVKGILCICFMAEGILHVITWCLVQGTGTCVPHGDTDIYMPLQRFILHEWRKVDVSYQKRNKDYCFVAIVAATASLCNWHWVPVFTHIFKCVSMQYLVRSHFAERKSLLCMYQDIAWLSDVSIHPRVICCFYSMLARLLSLKLLLQSARFLKPTNRESYGLYDPFEFECVITRSDIKISCMKVTLDVTDWTSPKCDSLWQESVLGHHLPALG